MHFKADPSGPPSSDLTAFTVINTLIVLAGPTLVTHSLFSVYKIKSGAYKWCILANLISQMVLLMGRIFMIAAGINQSRPEALFGKVLEQIGYAGCLSATNYSIFYLSKLLRKFSKVEDKVNMTWQYKIYGISIVVLNLFCCLSIFGFSDDLTVQMLPSWTLVQSSSASSKLFAVCILFNASSNLFWGFRVQVLSSKGDVTSYESIMKRSILLFCVSFIVFWLPTAIVYLMNDFSPTATFFVILSSGSVIVDWINMSIMSKKLKLVSSPAGPGGHGRVQLSEFRFSKNSKTGSKHLSQKLSSKNPSKEQGSKHEKEEKE